VQVGDDHAADVTGRARLTLFINDFHDIALGHGVIVAADRTLYCQRPEFLRTIGIGDIDPQYGLRALAQRRRDVFTDGADLAQAGQGDAARLAFVEQCRQIAGVGQQIMRRNPQQPFQLDFHIRADQHGMRRSGRKIQRHRGPPVGLGDRLRDGRLARITASVCRKSR